MDRAYDRARVSRGARNVRRSMRAVNLMWARPVGCGLRAVWCLVLATLLSVSVPPSAAHVDVTTEQARDLIASVGRLIVVDVREPHEYCDSAGHIGGALNYPWSSGVLQERYAELPRGDPIMVYCRLGIRSDRAADFMDEQGYAEVYDMLGGITAWQWEKVACVDTDQDGFNDDLDNCPGDYNPSQIDSDGDGLGNACDGDCPRLFPPDAVSFDDLAVLALTWRHEGADLPSDLNSDGIVNIADLMILARYWLSTCGQQQ